MFYDKIFHNNFFSQQYLSIILVLYTLKVLLYFFIKFTILLLYKLNHKKKF